ncbi:MAG: GAF domain-containing sensor histidine kinase [Acidobacteriota bacterium]|nr:GAF domain-containing sensor histidine kinase [Acidobacteriota bacterium]
MTEHHSEFVELFERMSDPAIVIDDTAGRVLACNKAFAALAARAPESLAGSSVDSVLEFDASSAEQEERGGSLLIGGARQLRVRVASLACRWEERAAMLYIVRRDDTQKDAHEDAREKSDLDRLARDQQRTLFDYLQEATEQIEIVNRVVAAVNASRTIDEVFDLASRHIGTLVPFDRASVALCEGAGCEEAGCEVAGSDGAGERLRVFALAGSHAGSLSIGAVAPLGGSVTEHALREREIVSIPEFQDENRFNGYEDLHHGGFRSAVCVPLFSADRAIGSLNVTSRTPGVYRRRHLSALERLAAPLAIAIEKALLITQAEQRSREMEIVALTNAELYEVTQLRNQELHGLYEISRAFTTLTDISEINGRLAQAIAQLVGGTMGLIATYDRRQNVVRAESPGFNTTPELIREFRFKLDGGQLKEHAAQAGEAFISNDPALDSRFNKDFIRRYDIRSVLSVPMKLKHELIGFIYVANRPGGFRPRDLRLLEIFAAQAAETIVNARLFVTIQAQAEREAIVNRLLLSLQRSGDPKEKVRAVIERIGQVLELDRCIAVLFAEDEHADFYDEWCRLGVAPITGRRDVLERSPIRYLLRTHRRALMAEDVSAHPLAAGLADAIELTELKSLLVVPVMNQGRVIGSLSAHQTRRARQWTEDDVDLLTAVATHVGSTLENARLIVELREAGRLKDEFLAMLSHELRTPLTAITGWVDLLSESDLIEAHPDLVEGVQAISTSAASLAQLISDLLDLSRIQRDMLHLERETLDVNEAVTSAVRAVRQVASARGHEIQLQLEENLPQTMFDAQRIQQVLWNLLTNAIKFTPRGGRIVVSTRPSEEPVMMADEATTKVSKWILIKVEDNGEGIPTEFIPFIWERFRQADSSATRRHGGLGIGLALVKELVEAHEGRVDVASNGRGASFTVYLPLIQAGSSAEVRLEGEQNAGTDELRQK